MAVTDYIPQVVYHVQQAGEIAQTALTEKVWGSSGRGNATLTTRLFPWMVAMGYLKMRPTGRAKLFSVTAAGIKKMDDMCKARGYTVPEGYAPIPYGE